jgi:UDP-N-acetylmuramoyl-tripeptide--D-alanyl-D-alanine ligase
VEMAMRGRGQIRELARVALPDVGVITTIAPVHLELVGTVEDVAAAKAELIEELEGGTAVVPAGETLLELHLDRFRGRIVTFGAPEADVHVVDEERRGESTHALVDAFGHRSALEFSFTGGHYLHDALAALAAFVELGYPLEKARAGAARVAFSDLRGAVSPLAGGGLLLNDAYNANPVAMKAALDHLVSIADGRPTVAVLGDMYELGEAGPAYHREVAEYCAAAGVRLVAVGDLGRDYLTGAAGEVWFASVDDCVAALPEAVPPGSAVLVKASRGLRLERVADALSAVGGSR